MLRYSLYFFLVCFSYSFFFNVTATTEIYTLSLHDALPIFEILDKVYFAPGKTLIHPRSTRLLNQIAKVLESHPEVVRIERSEEHTSELQSRVDLVCRLLLEKKKKNK